MITDKRSFSANLVLGACIAVFSGCASNQNVSTTEAELAARAAVLDERESSLRELEMSLKEQATQAPAAMPMHSDVAMDPELLPPDAKPGECYARVWVEPTYRTLTEQVLVADADARVEVIPARYEMAEETVLVSEASTRLETIPAVYGTESESKLVKAASRSWRLDKALSAAPASENILDAASEFIDLDAADVGQCFHEHYRPAQYTQVSERVLVAEGYEVVETSEAEYRWIEKEVLVREASTELQQVDAVYRTETEQVVDVPAHTVWKKGTGPIQKIDEATGEIMCLVEVPATYKTITKKVLVSPATTREITIPAEYKTVKVRELVADASESRRTVDPKYDDVLVTQKTEDASFVWHEIHDTTEPANTRTGRKICLVEEPAQYKTITRQVVKTPAYTREVAVPAQYETVKVRKLVSEAREVREEIPARYETVTRSELDKEGHMQWRTILCETNITSDVVSQIQRRLKQEGYDPGPVDGVIGKGTIDAVNRFQRDQDLPVDRYLNIETVRALNISI